MTIIEHALKYIELQMLEQHSRIEAAKQMLVQLELEKQFILAEVMRHEGVEPAAPDRTHE